MLEKLFDEAAVAIRARDEQKVEQLISQLAKSSDEKVIDVAVGAFRRPDKLRQWVAIRVFHLLGYPTNEPAIPELIYHIGDPNLPGWEEAVKTLRGSIKYPNCSIMNCKMSNIIISRKRNVRAKISQSLRQYGRL